MLNCALCVQQMPWEVLPGKSKTIFWKNLNFLQVGYIGPKLVLTTGLNL
jgi:hypothetical protein